MRTGSLAIFPLTVEDSGTVECVAGVVASDDTTGGDEVPNDREAAELVVLGEQHDMSMLHVACYMWATCGM